MEGKRQQNYLQHCIFLSIPHDLISHRNYINTINLIKINSSPQTTKNIPEE